MKFGKILRMMYMPSYSKKTISLFGLKPNYKPDNIIVWAKAQLQT